MTFGDSQTCYVSNQDTNVVAQVRLSNQGLQGQLPTGCVSAYLNTHNPGTYLDGTFVASHRGSLDGVAVQATDVPHHLGGLDAAPSSGPVQHSVRGVANANGILFVCNEAGNTVCMYALADGTFLGSSNTVSEPTHLTLQNGNLYVSTRTGLFWCQVPTSTVGATCSLQQLQLTPAVSNPIGGLAFEGANPLTAYVPIQGQTSDGSAIYAYTVMQTGASTPPVFSNGNALISGGPNSFQDTPEFVAIWV